MTPNEINTLENKAFRLECEQMQWRMFRDEVERFLSSKSTFGNNTEKEYSKLQEELEKIKYY